MAIAGVQGPLVDGAIVEFVQQQRLPSMFPFPEAVALGGLMSFNSDANWPWYRAATYVDKILKGTKPADLPVEQNEKSQLVLNLRTARDLGVSVPPAVTSLASEVIQ